MNFHSLPARNRRRRHDNNNDNQDLEECDTIVSVNVQCSPATTNNMAWNFPDAQGTFVESSTAGYEYIDHTADVGIRAWGTDLIEAFQQAGLALFNYMTDISLIKYTKIEQESLDLSFYHYMDELLYLYGSSYFIASRITVETKNSSTFYVRCEGEVFDKSRHTQGTEVKAITLHQLSVNLQDCPNKICIVQALLDI